MVPAPQWKTHEKCGLDLAGEDADKALLVHGGRTSERRSGVEVVAWTDWDRWLDRSLG